MVPISRLPPILRINHRLFPRASSSVICGAVELEMLKSNFGVVVPAAIMPDELMVNDVDDAVPPFQTLKRGILERVDVACTVSMLVGEVDPNPVWLKR